MKIELTLKRTESQFLGIVNDKPIIIEMNQTLLLEKEEWEKIKNKKWNLRLIENDLLEIKEIDKKLKRIEKDIEKGKLEINE